MAVEQEDVLDVHGNKIEGRTCGTCDGRGLCPTCDGTGQVIDPSEVERPATQALDTQALNHPEAVSAEAISSGKLGEQQGLTAPREGSPTIDEETQQPEAQRKVQEAEIAAAEKVREAEDTTPAEKVREAEDTTPGEGGTGEGEST